MTPLEFDRLRKWLNARSGLALSPDKQYLVDSRLTPVARKHGLRGLGELMRQIDRGEAAIAVEVVEAMTTNETYFFRDKAPFEHMRDFMLPALMQARRSRRGLRIWCAAASTGQEAYSLAMLVKEMGSVLADWDIEIVATDLSGGVLEKSRAGVFSQFEVQRGLPIHLLVKYFRQNGETWQIAPEIRDMVSHRRFNLLDDYAQLGRFDIILCRNVLIYFARAAKNDVLGRLKAALAPDGYLVLGAAETLVGLTDDFKPCPDRRCVYMPTPSGVAARPARLARMS